MKALLFLCLSHAFSPPQGRAGLLIQPGKGSAPALQCALLEEIDGLIVVKFYLSLLIPFHCIENMQEAPARHCAVCVCCGLHACVCA